MVAMKRLPAVLALAALFLARSPACGRRTAAGQETGGSDRQAAPPLKADFTLNGMETMLTEFKGKVVLLNFVTMWCTNCKNCLEPWKEWQNTYRLKGLEVVGVTFYAGDYGRKPVLNNGQIKDVVGTVPKAQEQQLLKYYSQENNLRFRLMMLPKAEMEQAKEDFHLKKVPLMILIDRQGKVRHVGEGQLRNPGNHEKKDRGSVNGEIRGSNTKDALTRVEAPIA